MLVRVLIAAAFSLLYASMYPVLIGGFVIYHYPYWPRPVAAAYVLGGVLLQVWFCVRRGRDGRRLAVWRQAVAGLLYAAAVSAFSGGFYQS